MSHEVASQHITEEIQSPLRASQHLTKRPTNHFRGFHTTSLGDLLITLRDLTDNEEYMYLY